MIFPGLIIAAVLAPLFHTIAIWCEVRIPIAFTFPFEVVIWGWIVLLLDSHIYMLFEGRRYWPGFIWSLLQSWEASRLNKLERMLREGRGQPNDLRQARRYLESGVKISDFPIDPGESKQIASYPTRLGNLIAAYEQYPRLKYGLDSVFFWYRLWVSVDKDLREEIDNQQALADGALYVCFAFVVSGLIMLSYGILQAIRPDLLLYLPGYKQDLVLSVGCFLIAAALYRLSLPVHAQFGELFKSFFDQWRGKLQFEDIADLVREEYNPEAVAVSPRKARERNIAVWRFLKWHMLRRPGQSENEWIKLP